MGDPSWAWPVFLIWTGLACICFAVLMFVRAPYGRHQQAGWGPTLPARAAWILMEGCSLMVMTGLFFASHAPSTLALTGFSLWLFHYSYRSFIYPVRAQITQKTMPLLIALLAITFNIVNAGFNGLALFFWQPVEATALNLGLTSLAGLFLFGMGFCIHLHSDQVLRGLRSSTSSPSTEYQIPNKGLHRWVSSPNYLGELIQWFGFALLINNLAAWSFFIWTGANLIPRAIANRAWYRTTFTDYPGHRTALIPFLF